MNQKERDDLRAHWQSWRQHRTHYEGCYKWHPECAIIAILDAWQDSIENVTESPTCEHQHLSTIARITKMGIPCPECKEQ